MNYKITDDDGKLIRKGQIRFFCPDFKGFGAFFKDLVSRYSPKERLFIARMIHFHFLFPPNDVISREYIDYGEMLELGISSISASNTSHDLQLNELLYRTVYNNKVFKLSMSEESYHSYRLMVLDEIEDIEKCLNNDFDAHIDQITKASLRKRLRLKFRYRKVKEAKREAFDEIFKLLNKGCKESEKHIVSKKFYEEAQILLEKFNRKHYDSLIVRLTAFYNEEYARIHSDYILEEIQYINSAQTLEDRKSVLCWIFENTSSRSDAFDLMKLDAEHIYLQCIGHYFKDFYIKTRKKMNKEERRIFQLACFQRKAFLGKIPILDGFLKSFWENNMELIIMGLVVNRNNPLYFEKNNELERKWREFLNIYPISIQNYPIFNKLNDKTKCLDLASKNFNDQEYLILKAFLENHEMQTICASYDISIMGCMDLIKRFQQVVRISDEKDSDDAKKQA